MRGRRYTAPPLISTCSVVCQPYTIIISEGRKNKSGSHLTGFITPSVPFAERRKIEMKEKDIIERIGSDRKGYWKIKND